MKKAIALLAVVAFVATIAGTVFARTLEEEKAAVRQYLNVVDAKIIKARKAGQTAKVKTLQAEKQGTLARWNKLKGEMAAAPPPPPPARVTPPPPPAAPAAAAPTGGLFGWGLNTALSVGYVANKSVITGRYDLILADPMGIGNIIGLGASAVNWRIGLGGAMGKDKNDRDYKAIPLFVDGIITLPTAIESYIGGGLNYVVYGTGRTGGSYGGEVYAGVKGDIGLGGKSFVEAGYQILRSGANVAPGYATEGLGISVGTSIAL